METKVKKIKKVAGTTKTVKTVKSVSNTNKISFCRTYTLDKEKYKDFTLDKYKFGMIFYDFEVFNHDYLCVFIDVIRGIKTIICNDRKAFTTFYLQHKDEIFCGYNSRNYDTTIFKSIILGMNPKEINDKLIVDGLKAFQISDRFREVPILNFDIATKLQSLKQLEAFMGHDIRETEVPFDLPRALTEEEIEQTIYYCNHDVEETIEVFRRRSQEYDANMGIIEMYGFPLGYINKTQAQLTAEVTSCEKPKETRKDDWDLWIVDTVDLKKYAYVKDWILSLKYDHDRRRIETYKNGKFVDFKSPKKEGFELHTDICGIPHIIALGGIHGACAEPIYVEKKGQIYHSDVNSLYPSIMLEYKLLTRNSKEPKKFKEVYDERLALKAIGEKKKQKSLKIVLNSQYGIMGDINSNAYDIRNCRMVCITGQLLIITLLEKLEPYITLIQSNTDGIIYTINDEEKDHDTVFNIIHEWEKSTRLGFATDTIDWIEQGTVNGYIFKFSNGEYERKGKYLKENNELDNDLPIVNEAMVEFIKNKTPIDEYINSCNDLIKFQKVVRLTNNYRYAYHNGKLLNDKTYRVFASKNIKDTYIGKQKGGESTIAKFQDTPDRCFIENGDICGVKVCDNLDKQWYIELAYDRLEKQYALSPRPSMFDF